MPFSRNLRFANTILIPKRNMHPTFHTKPFAIGVPSSRPVTPRKLRMRDSVRVHMKNQFQWQSLTTPNLKCYSQSLLEGLRVTVVSQENTGMRMHPHMQTTRNNVSSARKANIRQTVIRRVWSVTRGNTRWRRAPSTLTNARPARPESTVFFLNARTVPMVHSRTIVQPRWQDAEIARRACSGKARVCLCVKRVIRVHTLSPVLILLALTVSRIHTRRIGAPQVTPLASHARPGNTIIRQEVRVIRTASRV